MYTILGSSFPVDVRASSEERSNLAFIPLFSGSMQGTQTVSAQCVHGHLEAVADVEERGRAAAEDVESAG